MIPIIPALWLLGARGLAAIAGWTGERKRALPVLAVLTVAAPLFFLIKQNYMWTQPDTRVLAKHWIESNVPADSKILMDGMRYRFIQSPPLTPNRTAVERRVESANDSDRKLSRGVSDRTLELYAEAMKKLPGPKYDLHSTVWGLAVEELSYYPKNCFDFIVTSSDNIRRFSGPDAEAKYPVSVRFYRGLGNNPAFKRVFRAEPVDWFIQGPVITVYEVKSHCD